MQPASRSNVLGDVIDDRPMSRMQLEVIALCVLVAILDGFDTQIIGFLVSPIASSLGIAPSAFGPVFAAGLFGLMLGALGLAPLADKIGRKKVLLASILTFATCALLTAFVQDFEQLLVVRLLTGFGLGGAIPNLVALASEYSPRRYSRISVTLLFCGMPLGAMIAGTTTDQLLAVWGWRNLFLIGGVLPLVAAVAVLFRLPESVEFLTRNLRNRSKVERIIARLAPELTQLPTSLLTPRSQAMVKIPLSRLFADGMWRRTLLLWLPYSMNLLILYFIMSWVPTVLVAAHVPLNMGIKAIVLFSLGGVFGSILQGWLMNRLGAIRILMAEFSGYLLLVLLLSQMPISMAPFLTVMFALGILVQGAQAGLNALPAEIYPQEIRSTGVGWALGIGRIGSILGPVFGGLMLALCWTLQEMLTAALLPGLIALGATLVILFGRLREQRRTSLHPVRMH
ncbi:MFS transporter [Pseudomonas syringae]|uniref:MFS transporter n=1 Tax=Pseudomonas syringae TaxID=317 RepID=UPI001F35F3D8|nr:MFS transporter [Pseudomonas syringae]MCF5722814.1 MFS transporter [Pseudomonas syringae]